MKKFSFGLAIWLLALTVQAQNTAPLSTNAVRYMVTHEPVTGLYTAWVVPDYATPNSNNPESEDYGATAQFSLQVPRNFVLTNLRDLRGSWDKLPYKLTPPAAFAPAGADADQAYYVIGKAPQETNYGAFNAHEPVALFTFKGTGGDPAQVKPLPAEDRFVRFAETSMSLNVRNSFYSRSGQRAVSSARPQEQMNGTITLSEVLKNKQQETGLPLTGSEDVVEMSLLVYPNPASESAEVKYFSPADQSGIQIELLSMQGVARQTTTLNAKAGFNTVRFVLTDLADGTYLVRAMVQGKQVTKKLIKR